MHFTLNQSAKNLSLRVSFSLLLFSAFFLAPSLAMAATLALSPSGGTYHKGQNFKVSVLVNSDISINAIYAVLAFPTKNIEVIALSKEKSIINLWIQDPSFSNSGNTGNVTFEGVALNPGFSGARGRVLDITFRIKEEGSANLNFLGLAILANDGLGTNVASARDRKSVV